MKKLLVGLLALGSIASYADECTYSIDHYRSLVGYVGSVTESNYLYDKNINEQYLVKSSLLEKGWRFDKNSENTLILKLRNVRSSQHFANRLIYLGANRRIRNNLSYIITSVDNKVLATSKSKKYTLLNDVGREYGGTESAYGLKRAIKKSLESIAPCI